MIKMIKRAADIFEKIGVGSLLVGIFQHEAGGYLLGISGIYLSLYITRELDEYVNKSHYVARPRGDDGYFVRIHKTPTIEDKKDKKKLKATAPLRRGFYFAPHGAWRSNDLRRS